MRAGPENTHTHVKSTDYWGRPLLSMYLTLYTCYLKLGVYQYRESFCNTDEGSTLNWNLTD